MAKMVIASMFRPAYAILNNKVNFFDKFMNKVFAFILLALFSINAFAIGTCIVTYPDGTKGKGDCDSQQNYNTVVVQPKQYVEPSDQVSDERRKIDDELKSKLDALTQKH